MKKLILLLVFNCCISVGFGQQIKWERQWVGNKPGAFIEALDKNQDSSIVASGGTIQTTIGAGPFGSFFLKYDKNGTLQWQKYGREIKSGEQDIKSCFGSGYLFAGSYQSKITFPNSFLDVLLHRLSASGDSVWTKTHSFRQFGGYAAKMHIQDSTIYLLTSTIIDQTGSLGYALAKLDSSGNEIWHKSYRGGTSYASDIIRNRRGNFVISGTSSRPPFNVYHPYFVEVNANGDSLNSKSVIIQGNFLTEMTGRFMHNLKETSDGNYIFSGEIQTSSTTKDWFIVKLDQSFNKLWTYIGTGQAAGIQFAKVQELVDGSFVILSSFGYSTIPGSYHVIKVSAAGQFISRTTFTSSLTPRVLMYDWTFLGDGSAVVAGLGSNNQAYIARITNVGVPAVISSLPEPQNQQPKLGQSYPNPAAAEVTIPYQLSPGVKEATLKITEIATGRIMQQIRLNPTENQINLNLKAFKPGVYSYTLLEDGLPTATKKMVVVK